MWAVSLPRKCRRSPAFATPIRSLRSGLSSAAVLLALTASQACASDAPETVAVGYSPDGRYFAFEQYGTQDGSGFPYADIYVIDLATNSWVKGTPIRTMTEDETATLGTTRRKAAADAAAVLIAHSISEPALSLASLPATEVQADRTTVTFDPYYRHMGGSVPVAPADLWGSRYTLKVMASEATPKPDHCKDYEEPVMALKLTLTDLKSGKEQVVHADTDIPKSRGCPTGYDIDKILAPAAESQDIRLLALIGVYRYGFEGQDRRMIAIPIVPK
jgi:predicted secreted protein